MAKQTGAGHSLNQPRHECEDHLQRLAGADEDLDASEADAYDGQADYGPSGRIAVANPAICSTQRKPVGSRFGLYRSERLGPAIRRFC